MPFGGSMMVIVAAMMATGAQDVDRIDVVDAIECRLDAAGYNGFAMAVVEPAGAAVKRRWKTVASGNPFMAEYELPTPIVVAGRYSTRRIAFTATGILAILDLPDPAIVARAAKIENGYDPDPRVAAAADDKGKAGVPFRKFLGERVVADVTEPAAKGERFGTHTVIARNVSNAVSHPGKTFYGCSYAVTVLDKDGEPL